MRLVIGLPLHNQTTLTQLLGDLYDPTSPGYHRYLTPDQFTERFGPTTAEYQAVVAFAKSSHLTIRGAYPNRTMLSVEGTVADIENAFHINLHYYQHPTENRQFFAPDKEPSVASGLPILDIQGLSSFILPRPKHGRPGRPGTNSPVKGGTGPDGLGFMGSDFRTAYAPGVTNAGKGQTVALVEFDGYYPSDITSYESYAGIPTTIAITNVLLDGTSGSPSGGSGGDNGEEVTLDMEMVLAMAPGLSNLMVYEGPYPSDEVSVAEVNVVLGQIASDNLAKQISTSWVMPGDATTENTYQQFAAQGQSFFSASGDDGGDVGEILPPSDEPYVIQVGGTELTTSSAGGPWSSETVWTEGDASSGISASSGGYSDVYEIPSWQQGMNMVNNMGSQTMRNFPDVALIAEDVFVVADDGQLESFGGTSCAAPMWAAFTALVNQQAVASGKSVVGFLNPALYAIGLSSSYHSAFHDTTTGNNENDYNCFSEFVAGTGYDLCTGLGTPAGSNLINALLAAPDALVIITNSSFTASGQMGGPFNFTSQSYTVSNLSSSSLNWSLVNPVSWLQVSTVGGALAAHATNQATLSLSPAAYTLGPGIYTATVWFTNTTSHFGQSRQFALRVGQPLVHNGGFETLDFSYWLLTGDDGTYDFVDDGSVTGYSAHSGSDFAILETVGLPLSTISEVVPTLPGHAYTLTLWLMDPDAFGDGTTPNEFTVSWNGTTIYDQVNYPTTTAWSSLTFPVVANGPATVLQIGARNDNAAFLVDDVSLTAIPLPSFQSIARTNTTLTLTWTSSPTFEYQLQYVTALSQTNWTSLGSPITATASTTSANDTVTGSQRYYRVELIP